MTTEQITAIAVLIGYVLILWATSKIKRRIRAKKHLKDNGYLVEFV